MKILVTGANGQLGTELRTLLEERHPGITTYTDVNANGQDGTEALDLTDATAVDTFVSGGGYTHIVNCAAYTAVDRAETDKALCTAINVDGVRNLAKAAERTGAKLVHISTDFVFDGKSSHPYTESDKTAPLNHYGASKRKGETALVGLLPDAIIFRTGWLYSPHGHNFVKTILGKVTKGESLRVVSDQVGTPTSATDLATMILTAIEAPRWLPDTYNFANEGVASWYDFAVAIADLAGIPADIKPVLTPDYPTPASRPAYSVLDKSKVKATYGITIRHWRHALADTIQSLKPLNP